MTCKRCGHGCSDFSSQEPQLPSLVAIDVVERILTQALSNTASRALAVAHGEMSREEIDVADNRLVDWLGATFSGANVHFCSGEDWNPKGLASYARDLLAEQITGLIGVVPEDDEEVIYATAAVFLSDVYEVLNAHAKLGANFEGIENSPASRRLVSFWSRLLTGAPTEMLLN